MTGPLTNLRYRVGQHLYRGKRVESRADLLTLVAIASGSVLLLCLALSPFAALYLLARHAGMGAASSAVVASGLTVLFIVHIRTRRK